MIASDIINLILQRYKMLCTKYPQSPSFIPNNKGDSFYLIRKRSGNLQPTQIRLSNHGTYLETWVDREELGESVERLNPAFCINISIVFVDEGEDLTNDCKGMSNCEGCEIEPCIPQTFEGQDELGRPFKVLQYIYNSRCIRNKYINGITKAIMEASIKGEYKDPLANLYRAAKEKELHSSTKEQNKELNTEQYMNKKLIRLTESDLHRIVKESVNRILRENRIRTNRRTIKEGGHLYGHYDDGTPFTNSKDTWHGVPGTTFISHGEWSDPEVWYDNEELNGSELEDYMWAEYQYECKEEGKKPSEQEYDNLPMEWFKDKLDDYMFGKFSDQY